MCRKMYVVLYVVKYSRLCLGNHFIIFIHVFKCSFNVFIIVFNLIFSQNISNKVNCNMLSLYVKNVIRTKS